MSSPRQPTIQTPRPFADQLVFAVSKIAGVVGLLSVILAVVYTIWICWSFTEKLRELLDYWVWSIVVCVGAVILFILSARLLQKALRGVVLGPPVFGDLGGLPFHTFAAALGARAQISIELFDKDQALARSFNIVQIRILHDALRETYQRINRAKDISESESSETWKEIWEHEILDLTINGESLRQAADVNRFGINYAMSALVRSTVLVPIFGNLFWLAIVFLLYLYLNLKIDLLTGIQIGLLLTLILAAFWNIVVLRNLSSFPLTFRGLRIPAETRQEFSTELTDLEGKEVRPKKVTVKDKFYRIFRNYQVRILAGAVVSDVGVLLILLGFVFGVVFVLDPQYAESAREYHINAAYGVLIAGGGLVAGFYVFSVIVQNLRKIGAALIVALLAACLPYLIDYLLKGEIDFSAARDAIFAGAGGLTVALVTAVTSHMKESME